MSKSIHQQRIEEFMRRADGLAPGKQGIPPTPRVPELSVRLLRARLILEEALETVQALGFDCIYVGPDGNDSIPVNLSEIGFDPGEGREETDLEMLANIADGRADLSVVTIGTLSACGLPDDDILREVDENNLAKFAPGHSVDEHGKLLKPPGHNPPRLLELIAILQIAKFEGAE